ncbi:MAG: response regulator [Treponema sp.]|jgi:CheY-like chemotaxis protein/methyl-accepting chemotaxis protein|nr:response regulator [Treponema sp.]
MTIRKISWLINIVIIIFIILTVLSHFYVYLKVFNGSFQNVQDDVKTALLVFYSSLAILFLITIFNLFYKNFFIVKPLLTITRTLQKIIIDERTDLGQRFNVKCKNEAGTAAAYLNTAFDNIAELAGIVKKKINAFTSTGHELSANMSKTSIAVKRISLNLNKLKGLITKEEKEASEASKSIEQIKANIANKKVSLSVIEALVRQTESYVTTNKETLNCIDEIVAAVVQVNSAMRLVNDMSSKNNGNFEVLKEEIEKFTDSGGSRNKKILLVDDDTIHLTITENMLKSEYDVVSAHSGNEALDLFYKGFVPNLILLDLVMPDMDGWDVFEKIKAIGSLHHVPIAFFSSSFEIDEIKRAFEIGVNEYISKPVEKEELLKLVTVMLKK